MEILTDLLFIFLSSLKNNLPKYTEPNFACNSRVTFNTRNEVASEDTDGSLLVTYCPLEERIRRRRDRSPVPPGREPYKVGLYITCTTSIILDFLLKIYYSLKV